MRPPLSSARLDAYLEQLCVDAPSLDSAGLARLQTAHLQRVPFHNLTLLAGRGAPRPLPPIEQVVDGAIQGLGGTCDLTNPPFQALLASLGFDAHLAAATVGQPGDHFVTTVNIDGERFVSDVGNGHPYLRPWSLDQPPQEQSFMGWTFRFDPQGEGGPTLSRLHSSGAVTRVYTLDPTPQPYAAFAGIVTSHYSERGFGPFLGALRAVRILPEGITTLRDTLYRRDSRHGAFSRKLVGREAIEAALTEALQLPERLVQPALDSLSEQRPELFAEPRWSSLGRAPPRAPGPGPSAEPGEVPNVLISVATVRGGPPLKRLFESLLREQRESQYPGEVGVLVVDNSAAPEARGAVFDAIAAGRAAGLEIVSRDIGDAHDALSRAAELGLLPGSLARPLPIGAAREAQVALLREHLSHPLAGLPHPDQGPMAVWMVDEDLSFAQRSEEGVIARHTNLLWRVARYSSELPQHSVILGSFTGAPPVPGLDCLEGQLHDLIETVSKLTSASPLAKWAPPATPLVGRDPYYDLSEAAHEEEQAPVLFRPATESTTFEAALCLLRALPRLLDGEHLTRPLTLGNEEAAPAPSLRRGGNTLYLDLDALFRWPTPCFATPWGGTTRRSDTLWATLAQLEAPGAVVEALLPLHHDRVGQGQPKTQLGQRRVETLDQAWGVAAARALGRGEPAAKWAHQRQALVQQQRTRLLSKLGTFGLALGALARWAPVPLDPALAEASEALALLEAQVREDLDLLTEALCAPKRCLCLPLEQAVQALPSAVSLWRAQW